jgi:hypothetical protein
LLKNFPIVSSHSEIEDFRIKLSAAGGQQLANPVNDKGFLKAKSRSLTAPVRAYGLLCAGITVLGVACGFKKNIG